MGVTQVIIAVNKLDLIDYNEQKYAEKVAILESDLKSMNLKTIFTVIPISGYHHKNLISNSEIDWFKGPTLFEAID